MTTTTTSVLNDLIETLKDGQEGFRAAAEETKAANLKSLFSEYSLQRSQFAGELQSLERSLGERNPETSGSVAGAVHRGWINLKSALSSHDEHAILAEAERGEDFAVAAYRDALSHEDLPAHVLDTLTRQLTAVQAAHFRIRDLRDAQATK
jgi:uncharacterized protein (TIGR02284 family)